MNSEFHYYTTWFLAVKAGFSEPEAARLSWACQYTDHHNRAVEIRTPRGVVSSSATQNYSFWEDSVIRQAFLPFHFFPAGDGLASVRQDGRTSVWDVRPNSPGAKQLLVTALKTRDLARIGIALHTFADTWAHQNFTAWAEDFNRLDQNNLLPSPGHSQAGWQPDEWLTEWDDARLLQPRVVNRTRFLDCARKIFRYLCIFRGVEFSALEDEVSAELEALVLAGRGRDATEERMLEFVVTYDMEPYDRQGPVRRAVHGSDTPPTPLPALDKIRQLGRELWAKTGLGNPLQLDAKPGFDDSEYAAWLRAAEDHRAAAQDILARVTGSRL